MPGACVQVNVWAWVPDANQMLASLDNGDCGGFCVFVFCILDICASIYVHLY